MSVPPSFGSCPAVGVVSRLLTIISCNAVSTLAITFLSIRIFARVVSRSLLYRSRTVSSSPRILARVASRSVLYNSCTYASSFASALLMISILTRMALERLSGSRSEARVPWNHIPRGGEKGGREWQIMATPTKNNK
ncbi:hypothetical protein BKA56DRAFT_569479 [Ilyonectria sp. MPI-CAGE-AT-0026]|nr:hypothetical protein BKA56DRAFT_569479 [Ilyonectria sp. MPI-CAGE-AT-0026]